MSSKNRWRNAERWDWFMEWLQISAFILMVVATGWLVGYVVATLAWGR